MSQRKHVALLHAYSRLNSGDGLLVDLSVRLLREALGEDTEITVVAADPVSFSDYDRRLGAPVIAAKGVWRVVEAVSAVWTMQDQRRSSLAALLQSVDLIVGVGGGYLRARNAVEALKLELGHMIQMRAARASRKPIVYLPQSIGPALAGSGMISRLLDRRLTALLGGYTAVFVRDDRSRNLLASLSNVRRAPDLAVLEFSERSDRLARAVASESGEIRHVAMVLREAPSWSAEQIARYRSATRKLVSLIESRCRLTLAVQSKGRGNDDVQYYRRLGATLPLPSLKDVLVHDTPDMVISVRLHGALESVLKGVPAFHLSYERKGFGAYSDLGLDEWVANAADFNPVAVADRVFAPRAQEHFWTAAHKRVGSLRDSRAMIVDTLRCAVQC